MLPEIVRSDKAILEIVFFPSDITWYKKRAKRLRKFLATIGIDIKHTRALGAVSRIHGLNNYHELFAMIEKGKVPIEFSNDHLRFIKRAERLRSYLSAVGYAISQNQANEFITLAYRERQTDPRQGATTTGYSSQRKSRKGPASGSSSSAILVWNAQADGEK